MRRKVEIDYIEFWLIRIIRDNGASKTVVKEIEYQAPPTEKDLIEVLYNCKNNEFVSIAHNYKRA